MVLESLLPKRPCSGEKRADEIDAGECAAVAAEDVDGAAALGVEAGLVGEEAERRWPPCCAARSVRALKCVASRTSMPVEDAEADAAVIGEDLSG